MIGRTLGHYRILEKLGEGGMGVVYKAQDLHLDRPVALKVLPPEQVADADRKQCFTQEAKAASALNHPHIITIYDIASEGGVDFIAMEYVAGKTLDQLIPRKGMRLTEALKVAVQVADALAAAHGAGIIHRDIKPSNVMVGYQGRVKVLDFGLVKLTGRDDSLASQETTAAAVQTDEGRIVGTVSYMSPEQAQGRPVDARSDIFSFGSLLYEMVSGQRPFQGESSLHTLAAILEKEPPPVAGDVPHDVQKLITRCLRKDPERRFQHMKDLRVELEELKEESDSGVLGAATAPARTRRRTWAVIGLVTVVAVAAAAGWFWYTRPRTEPAPTALASVPLTSYPGTEASPSFSPDGNQVAFAWNGKTEDNFDIYVQTLGSAEPLRRTTDAAEDFSPAWSPDGKQLAFLRNLGSSKLAVILMPPLSGTERRLAEVQGGRGWYPGQITLAWHPGGKYLAVRDGKALVLVSVETAEKQPLTTPTATVSDFNPAFSADGRSLVFARGGTHASELYWLSLDASITPRGEPTALTAGMGAATHSVWTADGREIVFAAGALYTPSLWRMAVAGPGTPLRMTSATEAGMQPAISRDGRRLAYARWVIDHNIYRLDVTGGEAAGRSPERLIASSRQDYNAQFSPDGTKVAFQSNRSGTLEIWLCESDGANPMRVTTMGGPLTGTPRWSPDGQHIVFDSRPQGQSDIFVVAASGGKPRQLTTNSAEDQAPSWSRDGRWIYFVSTRSGRGEVWRTPAPAGGTSVPENPKQMTQNGGSWPFESADGRFVYYVHGGSLWRMPVDGGEETRVVESASANFAVAEKGVYFMPSDRTAVRFLDLTTKAIHTVAVLDQPAWAGLTASPDGRTLLFTLTDTSGADLMLVEDFR